MNGIHKDEILLALCGVSAFLAGILNGFAGLGGGMIMLFILKAVYKNDKKAAFVRIPAVVLPMTLMSAAVYIVKSPGVVPKAIPLVPVSLAGGYIGSLMTGRIRSRALDLIFASVTLFAGITAVVR